MACLWSGTHRPGVLEWALIHKDVALTEVPNWIVMTMLEDIAQNNGQLIEQMVMAVSEPQSEIDEMDFMRQATQKLMANVLLASLHDDGYIIFNEQVGFFDFSTLPGRHVCITESGMEAQVWEDLAMFQRCEQLVLQ
ncbi:MAG: hypothetical protein JRJ12_07955 [Deltaproteobacteria bacterium]|nr:hypothetical protein [Deltaproteobacteria bacterium]MBW2071392.1 hypothetical protein [Deltaproteobacteria bacterium]